MNETAVCENECTEGWEGGNVKIGDKRCLVCVYLLFLFINKKASKMLALCTPVGIRTLDPLIKSQLLYQLSYGCSYPFLCDVVVLLVHP